MLLTFVTAESIKYKNRELDMDAAHNHRAENTSPEPEPHVRRQVRLDVRTRRNEQHSRN